MTTATPLLLITKDPSHPLAHLAVRYARALLKQNQSTADINKPQNDSIVNHAALNDSPLLNIFFYADAAHTANALRWQSADQVNITHEWQALAQQYSLALPVCVSTALSRGISDDDNRSRHQLDSENLATGFHLVGLSELAMVMQNDCRLIQF